MKYQPLFMNAIIKNKIGVCKWVESGTTLATAVPEIDDLTSDKEEWRAIIVRFEDEAPMSAYTSNVQNPYDFDFYQYDDGTVKESEIPLVRLTHLLGGYPAPERKFEKKIVAPQNKPPYTIYVPQKNDEQEEAYRRITLKYSHDGKAPSSIVIISVRKDFNISKVEAFNCQKHREVESSYFWKRNKYPSNCRFLVYDFQKKGPYQRNADEYGFWLSILLLSTNEIDPSSLQGYRLYRLNTKINSDLMEENFQYQVNRLRAAKSFIEKDIRKNTEKKMGTCSNLPDYKVEVPVDIDIPANKDCYVSRNGISFLSSSIPSDIGLWNSRKEKADILLSDSIRIAVRALDKSSDQMRDRNYFYIDEVHGLNKYQEEDLQRETDQLYSQIIDLQSKLPTGKIKGNKQLEKANKDVTSFLKKRVTFLKAFGIFAASILFVLLCQLPAFIDYYSKGVGSIDKIFMVVGVEVAIILLFALILLVIQWRRFCKLHKSYNDILGNDYSFLTTNVQNYSDYMSLISSHARGCSYLRCSDKIKKDIETGNFGKYRHIKSIDVLLNKLRVWSSAFNLDVDFEEKNIENKKVDMDYLKTPSKNPLYSFTTDQSYQTKLNNSGLFIESPFNYTDCFEIIREEIYDAN